MFSSTTVEGVEHHADRHGPARPVRKCLSEESGQLHDEEIGPHRDGPKTTRDDEDLSRTAEEEEEDQG